MSHDSSFAKCEECGLSDCECDDHEFTGEHLKKQLIVGAKIKIGERYARSTNMKPDEIITLIEGEFDYENGLYTEVQTAPAIWCEKQKDYDSIYHLFGNDLEGFGDCEVLN